jgi:hypothetical protein
MRGPESTCSAYLKLGVQSRVQLTNPLRDFGRTGLTGVRSDQLLIRTCVRKLRR